MRLNYFHAVLRPIAIKNENPKKCFTMLLSSNLLLNSEHTRLVERIYCEYTPISQGDNPSHDTSYATLPNE